MAYGEGGYARGEYGGYSSTNLEPPNEVLPPPIPGGSTAYYYSSVNGFYPWAYATWAGGYPSIVLEYGGVVAAPDQSRGVVEVLAWWPDAAAIHVVRVHDDGSRHPVRGGYGVTVADVTRVNYAQNPSFEVGLNGVVTDAGTPVLTRIHRDTEPDIPLGEYAMRATVAANGSNGVTLPTALTGALPVTVGFDAQFAVRPTGLRVVVSWTDSGGGALSTNTVNVSADDINTMVGQFGRAVATLTPPTGAVTPTLKIIADGVLAGSTMDLDGITVETGTTDGSRFDGSSLGGSWTGAEGLSTSRLAPIQTVLDGEAPLDRAVSYIVTNPELTGGHVTSSPVTLPSLGRWCWLTHPLHSAEPIRVDLKQVPVLEHPIEQGVFYPIGSLRAVVVSARRHSPSTEITFNATSFAERDALLDLASDGMPMLLRAPARYGYSDLWWALGAITEDREGRLAHQDAMVLTAQAVSTREPSPAIYFQEAA
jgi:hypothetical protein